MAGGGCKKVSGRNVFVSCFSIGISSGSGLGAPTGTSEARQRCLLLVVSRHTIKAARGHYLTRPLHTPVTIVETLPFFPSFA